MNNMERALGESFLFHGILIGLMVLMIGSISQPPSKMPIDFSLLEPLLTPSFTTLQHPQTATVKAVPLPPQAEPVPKPRAKIAAKVPVKLRTPLRQKIAPKIVQEVPMQKPVTAPEPVAAQAAVAQPVPVTAQSETSSSSLNPAGAERIASPQQVNGSFQDTSQLRNYLSLIRTRIEHHKRYPLWARRHRLEGEVSVRFVLSPGGKVSAVRVTKSSGRDCLDDAAIEAVQEAAPMPSPPDGVLTKPTSMNLTIVFKLA